MKTLYIECKMGAAGDMLTAALLELLTDEQRTEALNTLQNLGIEGVEFSTEKVNKCGIQGTHVQVKVNGEEEESHDGEGCEHHHEHCHGEEQHHSDKVSHHTEEMPLHVDGQQHLDQVSHHTEETPLHSDGHHHLEETALHSDDGHHSEEAHHHHHHEHHSLNDVTAVISALKVKDSVKKAAVEVYNLIAQAEGNAHGVTVDQIHFHEVGNKDAIMDVTAVCYLMDLLKAEKIIASPVNTGSGLVHCAHGVLPVPAPATEYLLRGIPYYQGKIQSELCTPTGAALLKYFAGDFGPQPVMKVEKVGIGCGKKDFETANCVRIFMGETCSDLCRDKIFELNANVDDMTAEEIGFAMDRLFEAGAREVFTSPVCMKKNRPGTLITVICSDDKREEVVKAFFKHTTTIGIRQKICDRYILEREITVEKTCAGDVRKKTSAGYGSSKVKYEFDDIARIAVEKNISLREARALAENK